MTEFSRFAGAPDAPSSQSRTFEPENSECSGLRERLGAFRRKTFPAGRESAAFIVENLGIASSPFGLTNSLPLLYDTANGNTFH